jgi:class 3 adenylate cyclase/tetratricopeptide (TPR) repeat protein
MTACAACGQAAPGNARSCLTCGAPDGPAPPPGEERKTVTVLFCDLVGFTAASDQADPEDVLARIRPYHARLRRELEEFGGTVEKFIGDAVMAVFGAPVAHEDDPERAVRAGLRILAAIADLNRADPRLELAVRVGLESGEAVVTLAARPELGEGLVAGDVLNTASRLQGVAPVGGVVVGPATYAATRDAFDYQPLDPVTLKGKAGPVPLFRALAPRAPLGTGVIRAPATPMVGRRTDLGVLTRAFRTAVRESAVRLVVVAGEPGVGKSRLVAELGSFVAAQPGPARWRRGRCLPYGEGITFWALEEIIRAEAGISESDPPEAMAAKIDAMIPADAPDAPWLRARLRPLAGLSAPEAGREENFAAWRAVIELLAGDRPTVLVFEDLHWADRALLDFIEQLAGHIDGVPLLLTITARPELYERVPGWAATARSLATVNLKALAPAETARLVANLLGSAALPAGIQQTLFERSGGNPLYAEQFVRLLQDQQILTRAGAGWHLDPKAEVPLPPGVHGLIAARLDSLPAEHKRVLHDAAVIGKVFWASALAEMGDQDQHAVRAALNELARKELVRPRHRSSLAGQPEYAFVHALIREVCYGQIPRAERAERHRRAAAWIERMAGERAADYAEILAAHYTTALGLAEAARDPRAGELAASAVRPLMLAGDRSLSIDVQAAERYYAHARRLAGDSHPLRAELLGRHAEALRQRGRFPAAAETYRQAMELFRARGEVLSLARSMTGYGITLQELGDPRARTLHTEALALVEPLGDAPGLVQALADEAGTRMVWGDNQEAIRHAGRALALASQLGLPVPARALGFRGNARVALGDPGGLADMREARDAATAQGLGLDVAVLYNNLAEATWLVEGPRARLELSREGARFARRRGIEEMAVSLDAVTVAALADLGALEEAIRLAEELAPRLEDTGSVLVQLESRSAQLRALNMRGDHEAAAALGRWVAERAREYANPEAIAAAYPPAAALRIAQGDAPGARALLAELSDANPASTPPYAAHLGVAVRAALAAGAPDLALKLAGALEPRHPLQQHADVTARALLAGRDGRPAGAAALFADAAGRWERFQVPWERAQALLGQGRCLLALHRPAEARQPLHTAQEIFTSLRAGPARAEAGGLLAQAGTPTA